MKITVEFDTLQEMDSFCNSIMIAPGLAAQARVEREAAAEAPKKAEAKKSSPAPKKAQDDASAIAEEAPESVETAETAEPIAEKAVPVIDAAALKVELRKLLAKVNKKTGTNTASEWISEIAGKDKLTEVEDVEALTALKAKAEEALHE